MPRGGEPRPWLDLALTALIILVPCRYVCVVYVGGERGDGCIQSVWMCREGMYVQCGSVVVVDNAGIVACNAVQMHAHTSPHIPTNTTMHLYTTITTTSTPPNKYLLTVTMSLLKSADVCTIPCVAYTRL